jgi:hypothetical protein
VTEAPTNAAASASAEREEDAAVGLLDVRVVEEIDDGLPYLTDTGELVLPRDGLALEAWDDTAPARAGDRGSGL